jgi:adenine nucleotide transporter 17
MHVKLITYNALAGSIGSALAMLAFYPLERIRVELAQSRVGDTDGRDETEQYRSRRRDGDHRPRPHSHENFIKCLFRLHEEKSLYNGSTHIVTTLTVSNAIFFYTLHLTKRRLASMNNRQQHGGKHCLSYAHRVFTYILSKTGNSLISSIIAGCVNVMLTNPLWVASLRIMETKLPDTSNELQRNTLWNVMHKIGQDEGVHSLWNGTSTSLLLVSNPIIQHFIYEQLRLWMVKRRIELSYLRRNDGRRANVQKTASLSLFEAFVFGALSKTVATVVTYPLQLAQVLIRLQKKKGPASNTNGDQFDWNNASCDENSYYAGTFDCLYQQFTSGGIRALFQGMNAKLLQTVLTAAFTFLTYEQTLILVGRVYKRRQRI